MTDQASNTPSQAAPIRHALVVDDDATMVEFFRVVLTHLGYEVSVAFDGLAALDQCRKCAFELVVCDIRMPRLSGISFLNNVSRACPDKNRRIIMVSGIDDKSLAREAVAAGASQFLLKPVTMKVFIETVKSVMAD